VAWGNNSSGQIVVPAAASNVIAISAGFDYSLALRADGTLVQWGAPKLGFPTNLNNFVAIAAGYSHGTALRADGTLATWGSTYVFNATIPPDVRNIALIATRGDVDLGLFGTRAPAVTVQPYDRLVLQGSNTLFAAKFAGAQPTIYQWQRNGTNIPGATADTLNVINVQPPQVGNYQLIASNSYGVATSRLATLSLPAPPAITVQPVSQTTNAGAAIQFRVTATGFAPLTYQWRKDQTNKLGPNSSILSLNNVSRSNNGVYSVLISNVAGTIISSNAVLKVIVPQRFSSGALIANGSVLFLSGDSDGGLLSTNDLGGFTAQASSNLVDWVNLPNALSITNGMLLLSDPNQSSFPARFYRIVEQ
jgi:hypothetical protein